MEFINDPDHFDQHFLSDKEIIKKLLTISNLSKEDIIVEIGPGKGTITQLIASKVKQLICIELDERLKPYLLKVKEKHNNMEIVFGNALDIFIPDCNKIITSLPYSIIEPFISKLIRCKFDEIIMITGNKFASNVENKKITKLSLLTNCYFKFIKICEISPNSFNPAPRVMSAMIKLTPISINELEDRTLILFRYMFNYKDKKVKNALVESLIKLSSFINEDLNQRKSREIIGKLNIPKEILEKEFELCSNEDLKIIYENVFLIFK